jgi:flagellar biosynthesis/type III secretory pathway chaperone
MIQSTELLATLISRKHDVLVQLRAVGARQTDLVASGEIAALLKLLAAKQSLITRLQEIERELKPYFAADPEKRVWRSPEERARCAQQADDCNRLLEEVVRLEKIGAEKMDQRKNEVAQQLQHAHAAAHVRSAYQAQRRSTV